MRAITIVFLYLCCLACNEKKPRSPKPSPTPAAQPAELDKVLLRQKAEQLKRFVAQRPFNKQYACFIDFSVHSGKRRFVFYDLKNDKIISCSLVAHGQGADYRTETVAFSNAPGSKCSSPGKYSIGSKYTGRFGTAYKLHGLDATNNKAFERFVVLHGHDCVPDVEVMQGICRSDGCPTLNPAYFATIQQYLDRAKLPVVLWVYK